MSQNHPPFIPKSFALYYGRMNSRKVGLAETINNGIINESFNYDKLGRLISTTNALGAFDYKYGYASPLVTQASLRDKNFVTQYTYNPAEESRLQKISYSGVLSPYPAINYQSDAYRILNKNYVGGEQQSFRYDSLDRLTDVLPIY